MVLHPDVISLYRNTTDTNDNDNNNNRAMDTERLRGEQWIGLARTDRSDEGVARGTMNMTRMETRSMETSSM